MYICFVHTPVNDMKKASTDVGSGLLGVQTRPVEPRNGSPDMVMKAATSATKLSLKGLITLRNYGAAVGV